MQLANHRDKNAGETAREVNQFATEVVEIGSQPVDLSYRLADLYWHFGAPGEGKIVVERTLPSLSSDKIDSKSPKHFGKIVLHSALGR